VIQAGGQPISWVSLAVELQRDWARQDTVPAIIEIVLTDRLLKEQQRLARPEREAVPRPSPSRSRSTPASARAQ